MPERYTCTYSKVVQVVVGGFVVVVVVMARQSLARV